MIKISDLTRLIKAIKKADSSKSVSKTLDILVNDESDKKISELTNAGAITGAEFVPIVQGGVTVKTTTSELSGGGGSLQDSFDAGNTITMDGTHASGIEITRAAGGPASTLSIIDDNTRTGFNVDSTIGAVETNYDLQVIRDSGNPLPAWGDFGAATIFKYGANKGSFRVGTASGTQLDNANIGTATYAFGGNNIASGVSQFVFGSSNAITSGSNDAFTMGLSNSISNSSVSFALGNNNTLSGVGGSRKYAIGGFNVLSGDSADTVTAIGRNITLSGASSLNVIAMGSGYTISNSSSNVFCYYDGHFGGNPTFSPPSNTFLVSVGGDVTLQSNSVDLIGSNDVQFSTLVSVLPGIGNYVPNINFKVLVSGAVTKGTPLTPTATAGQVRGILSSDPIDTPIVGVAAEDSVGNSVQITGCELIPLKCATGQNFAARDLVERSSSVSGAVQIAAGPGPGVFAMAAIDFDGTVSGGLFYGWKINNFCAS